VLSGATRLKAPISKPQARRYCFLFVTRRSEGRESLPGVRKVAAIL
jgi:hypothetical protein